MPRRVGRIVSAVQWTLKNPQKIRNTVVVLAEGVVILGPALKKGTETALHTWRDWRRKTVCTDCKNLVIDNPLRQGRWCIARSGEKCQLCKSRVDAFGDPIPRSAQQ